MDASLITASHLFTEDERAALDADALDRWQACLPEPFNFLNEILNEVIDDVLLTAHVTEAAAKAADSRPVPDSEDGVVEIGPPSMRTIPPALAAMGADALLAPIAEGVYAVALGDGGLWLWDAGGGSEPQQLGQAVAGLVPCQLTCTALPPSTAPPSRRRLMLLSATPAPAPPEGAEEGAEPPPPPEAGAEDAQLLVVDLTSPSVHNLASSPGWEVGPVADERLAALAPATATLASDGRFAAVALTAGQVAVYHLPLPKPAPPPPDKEERKGTSVLSGSKESPAAPIPPPPPLDPASLVLTTEALGAPLTAVTVHFLLAPAPRAVGEPLTWSSAGLLLYAHGSHTLHQRMLPSRVALAAGGDGALADPEERIEWMLPGRLTASAISADSVLLATGLDEGSVVLWDTNVRSERYVLQRHSAAVTHIALLGATRLYSIAADHTLHGYDITNEPETGLGKLVCRRRLDESVQVHWVSVCAPLTLILLGCNDGVRVLDSHGDLFARLTAATPAPPMPAADSPLPDTARVLHLKTPGPNAYFPTARQLTLVAISTAAPTEAPAAVDGEEAAPAEAPAEEGVEADGGVDGVTDSPYARLECHSLIEAFLSTYPHITPLLGGEPTVKILSALLTGYKHEQRLDAQLMAQVPLFAPPTLKGNLTSQGGGASRGGRSRGGTSRASSVRSGMGGGKERRTSNLPNVPEDDLLQASRISSVRGSSKGSSGGKGGEGNGGLSEQMLLERQQSHVGSSGPASTVDRSQTMPQHRPSVAGGSTISGGFERVPEAGKSIDGRHSISGGTLASSAGTALSDAAAGQPPFVDPVAKVQRLQRSRLHGRFQREARVQRRWEELKTMAASMHTQQMLAQKGK